MASNTAQAPPAPTPPLSSEFNIKASTTLEHIMHIMHTEDAELPADELGMLMTIFSAANSERAMEIYVQSPYIEACRAYIKHLITTHNILLKKNLNISVASTQLLVVVVVDHYLYQNSSL